MHVMSEARKTDADACDIHQEDPATPSPPGSTVIQAVTATDVATEPRNFAQPDDALATRGHPRRRLQQPEKIPEARCNCEPCKHLSLTPIFTPPPFLAGTCICIVVLQYYYL